MLTCFVFTIGHKTEVLAASQTNGGRMLANQTRNIPW